MVGAPRPSFTSYNSFTSKWTNTQASRFQMGILCKKTSSKQAAAGNIKLWPDLNVSETRAPPFSLCHSSQNSDWYKNRRLGNPAADGSFSLMNDACRPRVIRSVNNKSAMTRSSWSNQPVLRQIEYWTAIKSLNRDCSSKRVIDKWSSSYIDLSSSNSSLIYLAPYTFTLKRKNCVEKHENTAKLLLLCSQRPLFQPTSCLCCS